MSVIGLLLFIVLLILCIALLLLLDSVLPLWWIKMNIKQLDVKLFDDVVKMYLRILDDLDVHRYTASSWCTSSLGQNFAVRQCCVLNIGNVNFDTEICISERNRDCFLWFAHFVHITHIIAKAHKRACAIIHAFTSR